MPNLRRLLTAGALTAAVCGLAVAASPVTPLGQPPAKDDKDKGVRGKKGKDDDGPRGKGGPKDKDGPRGKDGPKGTDGPPHLADLRKAYDLLTESAALTRPTGKKKDAPDGEAGRRYFEAAKRVYRDAVKANGDDSPPNPELAAAAHDAARGLRHWLAASRPADPDLPPPPAGPRDESPAEAARAEVRRVKDRLDDLGEGNGPAGKEFREAARRAYADARSALDAEDYPRAVGLARAAEAWSHVGEHLNRRPDDLPPPAPKRDRDRLPLPRPE